MLKIITAHLQLFPHMLSKIVCIENVDSISILNLFQCYEVESKSISKKKQKTGRKTHFKTHFKSKTDLSQ